MSVVNRAARTARVQDDIDENGQTKCLVLMQFSWYSVNNIIFWLKLCWSVTRLLYIHPYQAYVNSLLRYPNKLLTWIGLWRIAAYIGGLWEILNDSMNNYCDSAVVLKPSQLLIIVSLCAFIWSFKGLLQQWALIHRKGSIHPYFTLERSFFILPHSQWLCSDLEVIPPLMVLFDRSLGSESFVTVFLQCFSTYTSASLQWNH